MGEAPVKETINNPSPKPNKAKPKQRNKKVDIFGLKFKGFLNSKKLWVLF